MSEQRRYHFFRRHPNKPPVWCSTRTNRSHTMHEWIADLRKTFDVETEDGTNYFITDKTP